MNGEVKHHIMQYEQKVYGPQLRQPVLLDHVLPLALIDVWTSSVFKEVGRYRG